MWNSISNISYKNKFIKMNHNFFHIVNIIAAINHNYNYSVLKCKFMIIISILLIAYLLDTIILKGVSGIEVEKDWEYLY